MEYFIQYVQQSVSGDTAENPVLKLQVGPVLTFIHTMTPAEIYLVFQLVFFDVILNDVHGFFVAPGKTCAS
jgi:hypothetical protein